MLPAKPPFPTPWYLPFHPVVGIHTSILMSESGAGLISAMTRQKSGNCLTSGRVGAAKVPAATTCAEVIVVSGSLSPLKLSHDAARDGAAAKATKSSSRFKRMIGLQYQFAVEALPHFSTVLS